MEEEKLSIPMMGSSGREFDDLLRSADIRRATVSLLDVFDTRPPGNNLLAWSVDRKEAKAAIKPDLPWAWLPTGPKTYVHPHYTQPALLRLRAAIQQVKPNLVVAMGNVAFAALCSTYGIGKARGSLHDSTLVPGLKVLPTYHPSAILRQYDFHGVTVADFMKAKTESQFSEFRFTPRTLYLEPTIADLPSWRDKLTSSPALAVDIETKPSARQITCIGFAPSKYEAYVIPFWSRARGGHYWQTAWEENMAWRIVKQILEHDNTKILQNGMYDLQYCLDYRWYVKGFRSDTMIKHHSLYPGLPKGLDFLGSLYCNERAWKRMRPRGGEEKNDA